LEFIALVSVQAFKLETINVRFAELPASTLSLTPKQLHNINQHLIGHQSVSGILDLSIGF